jgi:H+/Cl- antiporter ClcA
MPHDVKALAYISVGILGLAFGVAVFAAARRSPFWERCSFLGLGILAAVYGALGYFLEHYRAALDYSARAHLDHYRTLLAGVAFGVFATLAISGQIKLLMRHRNEV